MSTCPDPCTHRDHAQPPVDLAERNRRVGEILDAVPESQLNDVLYAIGQAVQTVGADQKEFGVAIELVRDALLANRNREKHEKSLCRIARMLYGWSYPDGLRPFDTVWDEYPAEREKWSKRAMSICGVVFDEFPNSPDFDS